MHVHTYSFHIKIDSEKIDSYICVLSISEFKTGTKHISKFTVSCEKIPSNIFHIFSSDRDNSCVLFPFSRFFFSFFNLSQLLASHFFIVAFIPKSKSTSDILFTIKEVLRAVYCKICTCVSYLFTSFPMQVMKT
jgi:hypothetical protein